MNRKQRRRLQDGFQVATSQPIGIVDPVASISLTDVLSIPKVSSSPALLSSTLPSNPVATEEIVSEEACSTSAGVTALQRPFSSVPVSFTLAPIREENPSLSSKLVNTDESSNSILVDPRTLSPLSVPQQPTVTVPQVHILPPPVPPNILSNTQLDRKEKARIFMERLLNEKTREETQRTRRSTNKGA
ncbi:hypothetical protein KIN20_035399 [Parelaphostrongylus tenuis]|uniref:Uncharacterized protein n=1 Tax=Parelaphostrongylus tenuis TaxID=148309 RepID=A0AAD5RBR6_PARTN|nr:hypothetical protein KIN20_035399 [Parelaphostrongylus tenuis]